MAPDPEHYFTRRPSVPHRVRAIRFVLRDATPLQLWTDRGVFSAERVDPGTRLLAETFLPPPGARRAVDLGSGYGALGLALARRHPDLVWWLIDINERAVALCRRNAEANDLSARVACVVADGLEPLRDGSLDAVVTNPPIRAGRQVLAGWIEAARRCLRPGGTLWMVVRTRQGAEGWLEQLQRRIGPAEVVERQSGYRVLRGTWTGGQS